MRYVTIDDYMRICPEGDATQQNLESAEYDIDSLTFNRIIGQGFDRLAARQKELVTRAVCLQADFLREYGELLSNPLSSYAINGVSMSWDKSMLVQQDGVSTCAAFMRSCSNRGSPTVGWIGGDALEMAAARAVAGLLHTDHRAAANGPESRRYAETRDHF